MENTKKIRRTIEDEESFPSLPEELVEEIMSRLPVKSILKFRCVSKSWRSLVSTPRFIKNHLKNLSKLERNGLVTSTSRPGHHMLQYCTMHSLLDKRAVRVQDFDYPIMNDMHCRVRVIGSCNGIVCLLINKKKFMLWNPSTRKSKELPDVLDTKLEYEVVKYGFGFDESNDDYRVFGVSNVFHRGIVLREGIARLYSLKSNTWKIIVECPKTFETWDKSGTFVNGKLYWGRGPFRKLYRSGIDFFDLENLAYGKVKPPYHERFDTHTCLMTLGVLGGDLCLFCHLFGFGGDVWILNPEECWSKLFSISYSDCPLLGNFDPQLCTCANGEIIFSNGSSFVVYNMKDQSYRLLDINPLEFEKVDVLVESLVSL